ncbi:hypothetical protein, partial [Pseudomonas putida]|uniref:hypothetical protein n=1 Tax=Pseudomonas putida TaxID=303 RepID=UPI00390603F6
MSDSSTPLDDAAPSTNKARSPLSRVLSPIRGRLALSAELAAAGAEPGLCTPGCNGANETPAVGPTAPH